MRIGNDTLITESVDMSLPWESPWIWLGHVGAFSISLGFEGNPNGVLSLQCSNDKGRDDAAAQTNREINIENFSTVSNSEQPITDGGDHTWNYHAVPGFRWVRVKWLPTSGTGTITHARFNEKGF